MSSLHVFALDNILTLVLLTIVALLVVHIVDLHKRVRALRYCYMQMSDFCAAKLESNIEDCRQSVNDAYIVTPTVNTSLESANMFVFDSIANSIDEWGKEVDYHAKVFKRVGMGPINKADLDFMLED